MNVFERKEKENQVKKELCLYCWFGSSSWSFDSFDNIVRFECFGLIQSFLVTKFNQKGYLYPRAVEKWQDREKFNENDDKEHLP